VICLGGTVLEPAFTVEDECELEPIDEEAAQDIQTVHAVEGYVMAKLNERPTSPCRSPCGLSDTMRSLEEIADATGTRAPSLLRALRALATKDARARQGRMRDLLNSPG
jgi:hypothetical protein